MAMPRQKALADFDRDVCGDTHDEEGPDQSQHRQNERYADQPASEFGHVGPPLFGLDRTLAYRQQRPSGVCPGETAEVRSS